MELLQIEEGKKSPCKERTIKLKTTDSGLTIKSKGVHIIGPKQGKYRGSTNHLNKGKVEIRTYPDEWDESESEELTAREGALE